MDRTMMTTKPEPSQAVEIINQAIRKRHVLVVVGNCRVDYEGRASSTLDWGDRILIVKEDGAVLVHRPTGYEPVNWQPQGCIVQADLTEMGKLKVKAVRRTPRETVTVFFNDILYMVASMLIDTGEFILHVSELDLQRAVLLKPELIEAGFHPTSIEREIGEAGFIDVMGYDALGRLVIVELKRVPAGTDALLQLKRYTDMARSKVNRVVRGIIAAPELRREAQSLLITLGFEFKSINLRECAEIVRTNRITKVTDYFTQEQ